MKEQEKIKLINGTFEHEQAKDILINLINNKIHYHMVNSLGLWEKDGLKDTHSIERLKELKESRSKILELFDEMKTSDTLVEINSSIQMKFVNK